LQEEVNQKTISLCIKGGKISADILKMAMKKLVSEMERKKQEIQQENKGIKPSFRGKQSLKKLMEQGAKLTNIEITDKNIKSFDRVARKYSIDYSLKKDKSTEPPRYIVFFKAKDVDVMTKAFQEYAGASLKKEKTGKMSIHKKLEILKKHVTEHRQRNKIKEKEKEPSL